MSALHVSYGALWALVIFELLVLREVLRETVWLKRLYEEHRQRRAADASRHGLLTPEFELRRLGGGSVTRADLLGRSHILLFLAPADATEAHLLEASLHGLWHKAEGGLRLVWCGDEASWYAQAEAVQGWDVPVFLDEHWRLRRALMITTTPSAVMLDQEARVVRYGRPLAGDVPAADEAPHVHAVAHEIAADETSPASR